MAITYRLSLDVVLDDPDGTKAATWKTAIKNRAIQLKNAGTLPAWIVGTGKIRVYFYFIGGADTVETGIPWPQDTPEPEPEPPPEM